MTADTSYPGKPWQNTLVGSTNKLNTLYNDGYFADLTITFPGKEIKYKAHKVILAMSSSIFERMLFGPMAITRSELELPDDNPEAFKIVLAHCYEVTVMPSDIDEALEVFMLADKYFLEELSKECLGYIYKMFNCENIEKVLDLSTNFHFDSLKEACFRYVMGCPNVLLVLRQEWLNIILETNIDLSELEFEYSWRYPEEVLQEDTIIHIIKSKNCRNQGLKKLSGCVSAKVVNNICGKSLEPILCLSFANLQQANEILSILENISYNPCLSIHLQCKVIPADRLQKIPLFPYPLYNMPELYLSNVDDNGIYWAVSAISYLKPKDKSFSRICFPNSALTLGGFKILLQKTAIVLKAAMQYPEIHLCSSNILSDREYELHRWMEINIIKKNEYSLLILYDENEDIDGW